MCGKKGAAAYRQSAGPNMQQQSTASCAVSSRMGVRQPAVSLKRRAKPPTAAAEGEGRELRRRKQRH